MPNFTTIAHFISSMEEEITPLFRNILLICEEMNLIGKEMFAIDDNKKSYSEQMIKKIDSEQGREIYGHRMGIIEPVFGNIRSNLRLDHFSLRSQKKVNIQWLLYCMTYNIGKIQRYGQISA